MTTNPRDAIERALLADTWTAPSVDHPNPDWHRRFAPWMAALASRIALDAICPPGSRVVVSRESKPCETCAGFGRRAGIHEPSCPDCGGSGVVEATTTYGLEALGWDRVAQRWITAEGETVYRLVALPEQLETATDRMARGAGAGYVPRAVALPEETPQ